MSTTTEDSGGTTPQPDTSTAVTTGHNVDQVITTDESGTPTLTPVTSNEGVEAVSEDTSTSETQAPATDTEEVFDAEAYAKKKGIDLEKVDPKTLVKMQYDAEKKMHQANQKARELETTVVQEPVDYTGDPNIDSLAQSVNTLLVQNNIRDFFSSNPEAREYESKMAEIVTNRPHLKNDLDALYALARTDPSRESDLRQQGGREALTNLAQKQSQVPPTAGATNSGVYESGSITPQNVYEQVDKHDQAWFEKNHKAISNAMAGKTAS